MIPHLMWQPAGMTGTKTTKVKKHFLVCGVLGLEPIESRAGLIFQRQVAATSPKPLLQNLPWCPSSTGGTQACVPSTSAPSLPRLDSAQHCWIQGFSFLCFSLLIMPFLLLQHSIFEGPAQIPLSPRGFLSFFWALKECEFFPPSLP